MDIEFSKNQNLMLKEARKFLNNECQAEFIRETYDSETGFDQELWNKMSKMDWMALTIPESYGGVGGDFIDLCALLDEMGRALLPGPFFSTFLLSVPILQEGGSEEQKTRILPDIADGKKIMTLAFHMPTSGKETNDIRIEKNNDVYRVNGRKLFVPYAAVADYIIVAVPDEDDPNHITLLLIENDNKKINCIPLKTIDGSGRLYEVIFQDVEVPSDQVIEKEGCGKPILDKVMEKAMVGLSAENVGGAEKAMELAVDYAKNRIQFDKPIGSLQVIKHQCTDMLIGIQEARILMQYAAWSCENKMADSYPSAMAAMIYSSEIYRQVTGIATHIHGALGVTWENDMHLYYKRAMVNKMFFGKTSSQKSNLADWAIADWRNNQ